MNWDDYRFFLAIARSRSLMAASKSLGVSQPTVSRRLAAMENNTGVRLFDRTKDGYAPTAAGLEIFESIVRLEKEFFSIERKLLDQDKQDKGSLRITSTASLANLYLSQRLGAFVQHYPQIEISLLCTFEQLSLARREADVAIRSTFEPPETLMGRKVATPAFGLYEAAHETLRQNNSSDPSDWAWIGWQNEVYNRMLIKHFYPTARIVHRVNDMQVMQTMARCGLGAVMLPCYMADPDPELHRITPELKIEETPDLWVLFHPDVRHVTRVRLFTEFISDTIRADRDLFEGRRYQ